MADAIKVRAMNASALTALRGRRLCASAFCVTLGVLAASAAWAQIGNGPAGTTGRAGRAQSAPEKPPEPPPDAIPGAKPREPAAPATRASGDMQPTDALFDAINRGDIASARDALNRGADMNGVNILGMTPMELSVDLGRNDISFLLLSMRGEDSGRGSRALGRNAPSPEPASKTAQAGRPGKSVPGKTLPNKTAQAANIPAATKPLATPKLFANDGGTPLPSAGFLGFDSRSASN
jgi:hypothetical protein